MRSRILFVAVFCAVGLFVALPYFAHAAIPNFGPIIPEASKACPLGWGAVIQVVNNIIELALTLIILILTPVMFAYAGFLYVVNPVNPKGMGQAKAIMWHTVQGLVIALAAWLIVSAFMAVLYRPDPKDKFTDRWWEIINSGGQGLCLKQSGSAPISAGRGTVSVVAVQPITRPATTSGGPTLSQAAIQRAAENAKKYRTQVCAAASANGIRSECNQLLGIIGVESNGQTNASGAKGEVGLMQILPTTAAKNGVGICAGSSDQAPFPQCVAALRDAATNINAGVKFYAGLYRQFGESRNATAAYNGGTGRGIVNGKKQAFAPSSDCPGMYAWECPTNPRGFEVTQNYVQNVSAVAARVEG